MTFNAGQYRICLIALLVVVLDSCNNGDISNSGDVDPDRIFLDYHFNAYEEGGDIALKMQFRSGGEQGTTLVLEEPARVMVDGMAVPADSSSIDGTFYEVVRPFDEFTGRHEVVYHSSDGKNYTEQIEFPVFRLDGVMPDTLDRHGVSMELAGLEKGDFIQVMLTDTAAYSTGIERTDTITNGLLVLDSSELDRMQPGPVNFQLIRHRIRPLRNATSAGGRLTVTYSVSREVYIR